MDIKRLNDQRLKAYKKTLYRNRNRYRCECCGEIQIDDQDKDNKLSAEIKLISIEQMSRKGGVK